MSSLFLLRLKRQEEMLLRAGRAQEQWFQWRIHQTKHRSSPMSKMPPAPATHIQWSEKTLERTTMRIKNTKGKRTKRLHTLSNRSSAFGCSSIPFCSSSRLWCWINCIRCHRSPFQKYVSYRNRLYPAERIEYLHLFAILTRQCFSDRVNGVIH
jgi:hypothetical protein